MRDLNQPIDVRVSTPVACTPATPAEVCLRPDRNCGTVLNLTNLSFQDDAHRSAQRQRPVQHLQRDGELRLPEPAPRTTPTSACRPTVLDPRADWSTGNQPRHGFNGSINAAMPFGVFMTKRSAGNTGRSIRLRPVMTTTRTGTKNDRPAGVGRNSALGLSRLNFDLNVSEGVLHGRRRERGHAEEHQPVREHHEHVQPGPLQQPIVGDELRQLRQHTSASDPRVRWKSD